MSKNSIKDKVSRTKNSDDFRINSSQQVSAKMQQTKVRHKVCDNDSLHDLGSAWRLTPVITPKTDTMLVLTDHTNLSVYFVKPG